MGDNVVAIVTVIDKDTGKVLQENYTITPYLSNHIFQGDYVIHDHEFRFNFNKKEER